MDSVGVGFDWGSVDVFLGEVRDVVVEDDSITDCLVIVGSFVIGDSVIVLIVGIGRLEIQIHCPYVRIELVLVN